MAVLDMTPAVVDLKVYAGDENLMRVLVLAESVPADLTGAQVTAQARADTKAATAVAVEATVVEVDMSAGVFTLAWDGETLRTLLGDDPSWAGVWDVQVLAAGKTLPETVLAGKFTAYADVTRAP